MKTLLKWWRLLLVTDFIAAVQAVQQILVAVIQTGYRYFSTTLPKCLWQNCKLQLQGLHGALKENVLWEFLAPTYTPSFPPQVWTPTVHYLRLLYLRLHQTVPSKFSFVHCTSFVCLFVLQPNAKSSAAEATLTEDHPSEPSAEILKLCSSVPGE